MLLFEEFDIGSTNNPLNGIFHYSHHTLAWYCTVYVGRNSFLITRGSKRVKQNELVTYNGLLTKNESFFFVGDLINPAYLDSLDVFRGKLG